MTNKGGVGIPGLQKGVSTRDNDYKLDNFSLRKETYKKIFNIKAAGEQNKDGKQLMKIQKNAFKRWLKSFMDEADDKKIDVHVLPRVGRLANCKSSYPRHPCEVTQRWPYNKLPFDKVRTSREKLNRSSVIDSEGSTPASLIPESDTEEPSRKCHAPPHGRVPHGLSRGTALSS